MDRGTFEEVHKLLQNWFEAGGDPHDPDLPSIRKHVNDASQAEYIDLKTATGRQLRLIKTQDGRWFLRKEIVYEVN